MSRKIDALIAKHVMGWTEVSDSYLKFWVKDIKEVCLVEDWRPSTYTPDAMQLLEVLREDHDVAIRTCKNWSDSYTCRLNSLDKKGLPWKIYRGTHETLPMALCLAALDAKGLEIEP